MERIPRILHYCWFGGKPLPMSVRRCIRSWRRYCPGWEIRCWNEQSIELTDYPYAREALAKEKYAFVTDVVRLIVLERYGGLYLDTDVELLRSPEPLMIGEGYVGFEPARRGGYYVNTGAGVAAIPHQRMIAKLLESYAHLSFIREDGSPDLTPCTERANALLEPLGLRPDNTEQQLLGMRILPSEYLSPKNVYTGELRVTKDTFSIHHYAMSWLTPAEQRRYRYQRFVGYLKRYALGRALVRLKKRLLG